MYYDEKKVKLILRFVIGFLILINLFSMFLKYYRLGASPGFPELVRFSLTVILCYFLYKGKNWARVIILILIFLALGFILLSEGILILTEPIILAATIIYASSAIMLLVPRDVFAYFVAKRVDKTSKETAETNLDNKA